MCGATADHNPHQTLDVSLPLLRFLYLALFGVGVDLLPDIGYQVGGSEDRAIGSGGQGGHHYLIVTAEDSDPSLDLLEESHQEGHIPTGILDAHYIVQVGHPLGGPPPVVSAGALRDVVEDDRQAHFGYGLIVLVYFVERRLEVEGRHHQGRGCSRIFGVLRQGHSVSGVRAACAGDDRHLASYFVKGDVNDPPFLLLRQVDKLPRGPHWHDGVYVG